MAKETAVVKIDAIEVAGVVTGLTVAVADKVERVMFADLDPGMLAYATFFGLKTKFGNGAAIARDKVTGKPASDEEKAAGVFGQVELVRAGDWRATKGDSGPKGGLLFEAFKRAYPKAKGAQGVGEFAAMLGRMLLAAQAQSPNEELDEGDVRKSLRKDAKVAEAYVAIQAERAMRKPKPAAGDLIGGLLADEVGDDDAGGIEG